MQHSKRVYEIAPFIFVLIGYKEHGRRNGCYVIQKKNKEFKKKLNSYKF
jgi:hypothetical protein